MQWAEAVTQNTAAKHDDLFAAMKRLFTDAEIVELTFVSAMFNMINRLNDSLQVPIEQQDEINLIKRSFDLDPAKVQAYISWVSLRFSQQSGGSGGDMASAGGGIVLDSLPDEPPDDDLTVDAVILEFA